MEKKRRQADQGDKDLRKYQITIEDTDESYFQIEHQTVLAGMAALGRKDIPVGCHGGGCGVCKIEVTAGSYKKRVMSRAHISVEDEASDRVLACRIWPTSDLRLKVLGEMGKNVCAVSAVTNSIKESRTVVN
jgi:ferredoxin